MVKRFCIGLSVVVCGLWLVPADAEAARWKQGGDGSCYFDEWDEGPDQCSPGRWKAGGDGSCYWDVNDSGPAQCDPNAPVITDPVETPAGSVDLEVITRLVNAASQMHAWGISEHNVTPDTLPFMAQALTDHGFDVPYEARELRYFGGGLGGGGSVMSCAELYTKAQQWEDLSRGLQKVSLLYAGGAIWLSRMPGPAAWWATTWVAVGGFVTALGSANANWIAQDLRRQTCAA